MSIYSGITYNNCTTCNKSCQPIPTVNSCNCANPTPCSTPCATIPVGIVTSTQCGVVPSDSMCETTVKAECVILNEFCFLDQCSQGCENIPITLDSWVKQMCLEIEKIKLDIECLKIHIPACDIVTMCSTPIITNAIPGINSALIYWTPSMGNTSQSLCYKLTGTSVCSNSLVNTFANSGTVSGLLSNQMYNVKLETVCDGNILTSNEISTFIVSTNDWSFSTLTATDIKVEWNFPSIANIASIDIKLYNGTLLVSSQTITPIVANSYTFTGLTSNTNYEIVYGLTYSTPITFPEPTYAAGNSYLTAAQTLTKYQRSFLISTF